MVLAVIRPLQFGLRLLELFAYAIQIALNVSPTALAVERCQSAASLFLLAFRTCPENGTILSH